MMSKHTIDCIGKRCCEVESDSRTTSKGRQVAHFIAQSASRQFWGGTTKLVVVPRLRSLRKLIAGSHSMWRMCWPKESL